MFQVNFVFDFVSSFPDWLIWLSLVLPLASADIDDLYRELKDETVPEMWTRGHYLCNRIMDGAEKVAVNTRAYIIPRWTSAGGDARARTFDGDAFANGTNPFTDQTTVSSIGVSVSFSATELMQFATRNNKVAVRNFMARYNAGLIDAFKDHMECWLNAQSNDGIAAILSAEAVTTYTMDSVDDRYGGYLLMDGASYQIIASAAFPATIRATGPYRVLPDGSGLNKRAVPATVQFAASNGSVAAAITGWAAEDRVVFFGFGNAGFNSIGYHVGPITGTWQGVSRATPHNRSTRIDGGNNPLTAALVRRLLADISKYKGTANATSGLIPYCSQEQIVNWLTSAENVTQIRLMDGSGDGVGEIYDRMLGDVKVNKKAPIVSNRANPREFRFIRLSDYIWVTMKDVDFEPNDAGGRLHRQHNASGDMLSAHSIHIIYHGQLAARDVSSQGAIVTLLKPALGE